MADVDEAQVRKLVREALERGERGLAAAPLAADGPAVVSDAASRRVAIGSDHGGYALKEVLKRYVTEELGLEVVDLGTHSTEAVDYPDYAAAVAREVANGRCGRGIVVDSAGIGSTMAANKIAGVRCALCHDAATVLNAREHNDANLLALGSQVVNRGLASRMARLFLSTAFGGGRHERRVQKIMALERSGR